MSQRTVPGVCQNCLGLIEPLVQREGILRHGDVREMLQLKLRICLTLCLSDRKIRHDSLKIDHQFLLGHPVLRLTA